MHNQAIIQIKGIARIKNTVEILKQDQHIKY